jgi:hypothetical protein
LEAQYRKEEISKKELLQYHAAYIGGKCLLSTSNIYQLSKIDEERAQREAIEH